MNDRPIIARESRHSSPVLDRDQPWHRLIAGRPNLAWHAMDGLCFDDIPLAAIATAHGTPTWVYCGTILRDRLNLLQSTFSKVGLSPAIRYAIKANDHLAILTLLRQSGAGADVTSAGEFARAAAAGIAPSAMVFSGVGKRTDEISHAIEAGIGQINVESVEELAAISAIARARNRTAPVALRINPDVAAGGHDKISTGRATDKFGILLRDAGPLYRHAATLPGIEPVGFSTHIGSQIFSPALFEAAYSRVLTLIDALNAEGHPVTRFDLGGGFGIPYDDGTGFPLPAYTAMVRRILADRPLDLIIEPGRWLAGPAGLLLARVTLTKHTEAANFTILDAGMNDLLRPALYEATHGIVPVSAIDATQPAQSTEIVGPVCESSDRFGTYDLPALTPGVLVAILDAGAYGAAMSSTYNGRPLAAQVLIDRGQPHLIRMRQTIEQLWRDEIVPNP
ncbi:MAG: diaminopimelate decarboxylase [Acidiphilium sp.]|nr:diaminopimelate decarboxylase [Acidiphilium sp.]MDD4934433.1 diaminopimelate decarboxylase [Acidiphilium sp.]